MVSLNGLNNLKSIVGHGFTIKGNSGLVSTAGLENLSDLHIYTPGGLTKKFSIEDNASLGSLSGFENVVQFYVGVLSIQNCPNLSICNIQPVCDRLENGGAATIANNASGCNSIPEVEAACMESSLLDLSKSARLLETFPNPATDFLHLQLPEIIAQPTEISLFDIQGRLVERQSFTPGQTVQVGHLPGGVFTLKLTDGERVYVGRFVKQ